MSAIFGLQSSVPYSNPIPHTHKGGKGFQIKLSNLITHIAVSRPSPIRTLSISFPIFNFNSPLYGTVSHAVILKRRRTLLNPNPSLSFILHLPIPNRVSLCSPKT
ncbi:unnamed protein product [Sphenostylis stenocarpa]|uniref:Uncharacterized protein n=1 Tax=Sphenostylis stenocarpa TaxID=92480 RepID=A0AA87B9M8_9FABA|nr:unnamed protein product [Sphenostylis stenocarpa]